MPSFKQFFFFAVNLRHLTSDEMLFIFWELRNRKKKKNVDESLFVYVNLYEIPCIIPFISRNRPIFKHQILPGLQNVLSFEIVFKPDSRTRRKSMRLMNRNQFVIGLLR